MTNTKESIVGQVPELASETILKTLEADSTATLPEDVLPEDIFAQMHFTYAPMVKRSLPKLSKKELSRVIEAVVDIPPNQKTINAFNQAQKNVFFTLEKVLMAKYFMMTSVAMEAEQKKLDAANAAKEQQPEVAVEPIVVK